MSAVRRTNPLGSMLAGSVVSGIGLGTGFAVANNLTAPAIQSATRGLRPPPTVPQANPLRRGSSRAAVSANIRHLMRDKGYPQRQAVAAALEQARRTGRRNPRYETELGAFTKVPKYSGHRRAKNWLARISLDPQSPGGLARDFQPRAKGDYYYMATGLKPGDAVEFGADYYTGAGRKQPDRWYGIVTDIDPTGVTLEGSDDARAAIAAGKAFRKQAPLATIAPAPVAPPVASPLKFGSVPAPQRGPAPRGRRGRLLAAGQLGLFDQDAPRQMTFLNPGGQGLGNWLALGIVAILGYGWWERRRQPARMT